LVADDLAAGRLVRPFDLAMASGYAYFVVHPSSVEVSQKIQCFKDWILAEARNSETVAISRVVENLGS